MVELKYREKKSNYDRKTLTINVNLFVGHFTSSNYVGSVFILLDFLLPSHIGKKTAFDLYCKEIIKCKQLYF